ncbi:MAG: hypothetical protein ACPL0B_02600, partial [Anaerolineales bacterium]
SGSIWLIAFLRISGFLMTLVGGLEAAFAHHAGKLLGFTVMVVIGFIQLSSSLAFVSNDMPQLLAIIFPLLTMSMICLGVLGLAMSLLFNQTQDLNFPSLAGIGGLFPFSALASFIGFLSLAGFPITMGFPIYLIVWQNLFNNFPLGGLSAIVGSLGILSGSVRLLAVLMRSESNLRPLNGENINQRMLIGLGVIIILLGGILPQIFFPIAYHLGQIFFGG